MNLLKTEYKMMYECEFYFQSKVCSHYQMFKVLREAFNLIPTSIMYSEHTIYPFQQFPPQCSEQSFL